MEFHRGRLINHVHLRVADVAASKRFYLAVLQLLGRDLDGEGDGYFFADELFVARDFIRQGWQREDRTMVLRVRGTTIRDTMLPFCLIPMAITFRRLITVQWNDPLVPSSLQHLNRYRVDACLIQ